MVTEIRILVIVVHVGKDGVMKVIGEKGERF